MRTVRRHARITADRAGEFWACVEELVTEFTPATPQRRHRARLGRRPLPDDHPSLPDPDDQSD